MERDIPEKDWKLLRRLSPVAMERFCARVLEEATRIGAAPDRTSHERYRELFQLMRQQDCELAAAFDDHRRSTAIVKLMRIQALGLLTEAELAAFTEETRNVVLTLSQR